MEDKDRTLYCGNLADKVTEDLLYELFLQAGPLEGVTIPKDKDGNRRNYGFITFKHAVSVSYAVALMSGVSLFGRPLRLDARNKDMYNPYLEKLREYAHHSRHDHSSRRHASRRYDSSRPNTDNRYDNMNIPLQQPQPPVMYPAFNQPFVPNRNFLPPDPLMGIPFNQGMGMMPNSGWVRF